MRHDRPAASDLEACRAILRRGSKSFTTAALLLPRRVRDPATVLYAFCRVADDRVDEDLRSVAGAVDELRERLRLAYARRPLDRPVDRALAAVAESQQIPMALPEALLEGLAWDAAGRRYETLDELYAYAARVAGSVGAMMSVLMGQRAASVVARACELGIAMQLTNIARDVGEDAARGRIYLPLAWMRAAGVDPDAWLARPEPSPEVRAVVSRVLRSAEDLYARADSGIAALPADCRVAIRAARLIYSEIGRFVAQAGYDSVTRRAVVPRVRKILLLLRSVGARFWLVRKNETPCLEPNRFLVAACETTR